MRDYRKIAICCMLILSACGNRGEYPTSSIKIRPSSTAALATTENLETIENLLETSGYQKIVNYPLDGKRGYLPGEGEVEIYHAYRLKNNVAAVVARPFDLVGGTILQVSGKTTLKDAQYIPSMDGRLSIFMTEWTKRGEPFSPAAREAFEDLAAKLKSTFGNKNVEVPENLGDAIIFYTKDGQPLQR